MDNETKNQKIGSKNNSFPSRGRCLEVPDEVCQKGISLISLIITIIVIIILAAIIIFNGFGASERAGFARFANDVSMLQEDVDNLYELKKGEISSKYGTPNSYEIYSWIAAGDNPTTSGMVMVSPSVGNAEYGASLPDSNSSGNQLIWYVKELSGTEKDIIEIDAGNNNLSGTLPEYKGRSWKIDVADGKVFLDPPYNHDGELYASVEDIQNGGTGAGANGTFDTKAEVNSPELAENMIPVYHDGTVWRKADSKNMTGEKWYDYGAKRWANIVTVTSVTRSKYSKASIGEEIKDEDVLGYFVWIPRYAYKLGTQYVDIKFLKGTTNEFEGGVVGVDNDYITHPVFTSDPSNGGWDKELSGIWVAKFESSSSGTILVDDTYEYTTIKVNPGTTVIATGNGKRSSTNRNNGRTGSSSEFVTVRPNVTSWRNISIPNIITKSKQLAIRHGINADSHMMKNTQWGAVAYLTQSDYGNPEIWNNPYSEGEIYATTGNGGYGMNSYCDTITGMVGNSQNDNTNYYAEKTSKTYNSDGTITIGYNNINADGTVGTPFSKTFSPYNSTKGFNGSTTGNIYGIYDMASGAWEFVAAYVNNGSSQITSYATGLSGKYVNIYESSNSDNGIVTPDYETNSIEDANYLLSESQKGDAVFETSTNGHGNSAWSSDSTRFPFGTSPFFVRGAYFDHSSFAGVFAFARYNGAGDSRCGFRVVLVL